MIRLFHRFVLRPLRRDLTRTALTVISVMLGVAVVIAIDLAGDAAAGSFRSSLEGLTGRADLEITATGGVDENWMTLLSALPRNASFAPVIETAATVEGFGDITMFGVDLVAHGAKGIGRSQNAIDSIVLSSALRKRLPQDAANLRLTVNDAVRIFPIAGAVEAGLAEFAVLDIATAQEAFRSYGRLDRIEVTVAAGENFAALEREIRRLLPPSYAVTRAGARTGENQRMLRAFRWNLRMLSYISLVVGAFFIYNTISVSVVRRRAEIGILRALGASRSTVAWLFLGEALALALAGAVAGVLLGRAMAEGVVRLIAATVNALYTSSRPAPVEIDGLTVFGGIALGLAVAALSALGPALEAMSIAPAEALGRGAHEHRARTRWSRNLAGAGALAAAALACAQFGPLDGRPVAGYISAFLAIGAGALAAPLLVIAVTYAGRSFSRRMFGAEGMLAGRSLAASLPRTSVIVAALATAIAMMASVAIMVGSFRETVVVWLDYQLRADLYLRPAHTSGAGRFPALSTEIPRMVASLPGVEAVDVFHALEFRYRGVRATLGGGDMGVVLSYGRLRFLPGQDRGVILGSLPGADRAIVSEPFANKHGVRAGDRIVLPLGDRSVEFTVAGVYYEYSSESGYVVVDRSTLLKYLPHQPPTNVAIFLARGAEPANARARLQTLLSGRRVSVSENAGLRRRAVEIFDRTFAITWALELIAIVVAMLGAANSLLALALDRRRELGLLRFLGASARQVRRMILIEAGFVGVLGCILGAVLGSVLSLLLVYVVNKQSFGWTIQFHPPLALLTGALSLVWSATVLAALYPARVAARLKAVEVIHEE